MSEVDTTEADVEPKRPASTTNQQAQSVLTTLHQVRVVY